MPRKSVAKKATAQRTFHLPSHVATAFDKVCEHFDEPADRVARKFFEDALRSVAREYNLTAVLETLGEEKKSPFGALAAPYNYEPMTYDPPAPAYPPVTPRTFMYENGGYTETQPMASRDSVLPFTGPPLPLAAVDEG